ncbi:MAG: HD domain-containing phosphohydrolase [Candidatus Competibacteraceae bacterium]
MLNALPWPKSLHNVPEYAGSHHETLDGGGYHRGLREQDLSIQARIICLADVFEALTARDRPTNPANRSARCWTSSAGWCGTVRSIPTCSKSSFAKASG